MIAVICRQPWVPIFEPLASFNIIGDLLVNSLWHIRVAAGNYIKYQYIVCNATWMRQIPNPLQRKRLRVEKIGDELT